MDSPDIAIPEGGGKRHKPLSSPPKIVESDLSTIGYNDAVVDGPGTAYGFTTMENLRDVNENRTTDDMD